MFIAALFIIAKIWKQPKHPFWMSRLRNCGIYTMEYYSAINKE